MSCVHYLNELESEKITTNGLLASVVEHINMCNSIELTNIYHLMVICVEKVLFIVNITAIHHAICAIAHSLCFR